MGMLVRELHRAEMLCWVGTVGEPIREMSGVRGTPLKLLYVLCPNYCSNQASTLRQ